MKKFMKRLNHQGGGIPHMPEQHDVPSGMLRPTSVLSEWKRSKYAKAHTMSKPIDKYKNFPFRECIEAAGALVSDGAIVFQKWTCAKCGERVIANLPNTFTTSGRHEERKNGKPCGWITNIEKNGCNYMVVARGGTKAFDEYLTSKEKPE